MSKQDESDRWADCITRHFAIVNENQQHLARVLEIYGFKSDTAMRPMYREVITYDMSGVVCSATKAD